MSFRQAQNHSEVSENSTSTANRESSQQLETSNLRQFLQTFNLPYESNWQSLAGANRITDYWISDPRFSNAKHDHVFSIWVNDHENGDHVPNDHECLESNEDDQIPDLELPPPSYSEIENVDTLPPPSYEVAFQNEVDQIQQMTVITKKLGSNFRRSTLV